MKTNTIGFVFSLIAVMTAAGCTVEPANPSTTVIKEPAPTKVTVNPPASTSSHTETHTTTSPSTPDTSSTTTTTTQSTGGY